MGKAAVETILSSLGSDIGSKRFYAQMKAFINLIKNGKLDWLGMDLSETLKTMELAKEFAYA